MRTRTYFLPAACALSLMFLGTGLAQVIRPRAATVTTESPVFLLPDANRTPLQVLKAGTSITVVDYEQGGWLQVEFNDPGLGRRTGYIQAKNVQISAPASAPSTPPQERPARTPVATPAPVRPELTPAVAATPPPTPSSAPKVSGANGPTKVFVTSSGAANGFTDPSRGNRDTVKDLRDSLKKYKAVALVDGKDDAAIMLTVMGRDTAQVTAGLLGDPARDRIIRVKFAFRDFETEMTASAQGGTLGSGGSWGRAAGKIAKQVDEWITANRSKLAAK